MFFFFYQSVTAMATQKRAILTWRCIWPLEMSVEEYVMTVSTTPWDATVRCANLSTTKTLERISGIHEYAYVSVCVGFLVFF